MRERDKFMAEAEFKVNHQLTIDTDWWRERGHSGLFLAAVTKP